MDSLSQIVLGAAVGEVLLGRKIGNRAQLLGAIGGTIPDLDILFNGFFSDPIAQLHIHRGYSHSMFVHLLLALPFAWLGWKWLKDKITFRQSYLAWYLFFLTHTLLDCCTTYGTQLFLPFTDFLVGFNTISVIDPLWTLPFLLTLLVCLFIRREKPLRMKWAKAGLIYSSLYMLMTLVNKWQVHRQFQNELDRQGIAATTLSTTPTMLNNLLWAGIALTQDSLFVAEYSLLQSDKTIEWVGFARNEHLLANHPAKKEIESLKWFSQGFYFVEESETGLRFFLVKWGRMDFSQTEASKAFVFHWKIDREGTGWKARPVEPSFGEEEFKLALQQLWGRIKNKK